MNTYELNCGHYVVYTDYSNSGLIASLPQSSADPASLSSIMRGTIMVMKTHWPTESRVPLTLSKPKRTTEVHIKPGQEWFWSEEWQAAEREAEADLVEGRFETFDNDEDFLANLV
jgi:hypothetical protein